MNAQAKGFTIVELLIIIVVIAILATVSVITYNGIQNRSAESVLKSDLRNASTQLGLNHAENGSYAIGTTPPAGIESSEGTTFQYTGTDGTSYCLTATSNRSGVSAWHTASDTGLAEGVCEGHTGGGSSEASVPTRGGFTDLTFSYSPNHTILAPIGDIPTSSWMIVVLAYTNNEDPVPPADWATLVTRKATGTLRTSIYAKVKQPGDDANQEFNPAGYGTTNAALMWGAGSAPVTEWILGVFGDRANNATPTTAVTPTITTSASNSLVLSIATERTMADELNYTSMTGATPWVWIPQPIGNAAKIQTISVGYNEQVSTGVSQSMTITYPNAQALNATAIQIGIPPES